MSVGPRRAAGRRDHVEAVARGRRPVGVQRDHQPRADALAELAAGVDARTPPLSLLVFRVIRTRAPSASQPLLRPPAPGSKFTVASGTPLLVAVPVVLHGFSKPPAGTRALIWRE